MKKYLAITFLLFFISCGSTDNSITEVGNPTDSAATASATTKALTQGVVGLIDTLELSESINQAQPGLQLVTISMENFECSYSVPLKTLTCNCPQGGTFTREFESSFSREDGSLSFNHTHETTFSSCVITTCEEDITLNGDITGNVEGTYNFSIASGDLDTENTTTSACAGMTSNDRDFGFSISLAYDGTNAEFSGTFCMGTDDVSFSTLAELRAAVDPNEDCEDFGP